jgi:16S rRNA U516 pseudouridylate synthase RsuA-like enzyme
MFEAVGHPVIHLRRLSFAGIHVGVLRSGEWRYLTAHEVSALFKLTGIHD